MRWVLVIVVEVCDRCSSSCNHLCLSKYRCSWCRASLMFVSSVYWTRGHSLDEHFNQIESSVAAVLREVAPVVGKLPNSLNLMLVNKIGTASPQVSRLINSSRNKHRCQLSTEAHRVQDASHQPDALSCHAHLWKLIFLFNSRQILSVLSANYQKCYSVCARWSTNHWLS